MHVFMSFSGAKCTDHNKCGTKCEVDDHCPIGYLCQHAENNPYVKVCCESKYCLLAQLVNRQIGHYTKKIYNNSR